MGLGSFVDLNIFVLKYYFIWFLHILHFFRIFQIKIYTNDPKKGNSGTSFNDTLLNFGLRCSVILVGILKIHFPNMYAITYQYMFKISYQYWVFRESSKLSESNAATCYSIVFIFSGFCPLESVIHFPSPTFQGQLS